MLHRYETANPFDLYRDQFSVQTVREKFRSFAFLEKDHQLKMNGSQAFEKNGGDSKFCWYCCDIFAKNAFDREG